MFSIWCKMKHVSERDWVCTTCGTDAWSGDYGRLCFDAEFFDDDNIGYNGVPIDCAACDGDYPNCKTSCPMYDNY